MIFTSGSTGRPKGVAVSHSAVVNQIAWISDRFGICADDTVLLKTPFTFDVSVWELFAPLASGARLVVASADGHRDPQYLAETIDEHAVSLVSFVPSMLDVFVDQLSTDACGSLRAVMVAGEALAPTTVSRVQTALPNASVHNLYGPTEFTVHATETVTDGDGPVVPIGSPVWNSSGYVLDDRMRLVPDGVPGELYLSGRQVARGYVGRADLTADRFVADPFVGGARMYRTGDVVRRNRSGGLEYIGRSDFQVKLRGLRIELGEIESVLRRDPQVSSAAVVVWRDRLVAYVAGMDVHVDSVRRAVASTLPSYMVPDSVVVLESLPLNASGKLDRRALPEPVSETREFREPVSLAEQAVASVFAEVLGVEQVGLDDDFFALGGNSLIATQVVSRVGVALNARVPVRQLFESTNVEALAAAVEAVAGSRGVIHLEPQPRGEQTPLSLAQQRVWFLNRFDPDSAVNNIPAAIRLSGRLDVEALRAAVADLMSRHEVLRTVYPEVDGVGYQVVLPASEASDLLSVETVSEDEVFDAAAALVGVGFDVTAESPVRVRLLEVSDTEHVLVVVVHHIAADGFSMGPLSRDVMLAYAARVQGDAPAWVPLEVQYADYALWQRQVLGSESDPTSVLSRQLTYWSEALAGLPDVLGLPSDRPRPAVASYRGASHEFILDGVLRSAIDEFAREHGATPFMVIHGALSVVLARLSGTDDIAIGTPVAGRGERALDDLIGMFVNTLVLRTRIDAGESFEDLLSRVKDVDLGAFGHADVPFERLVEALDPVRSTAWNPLFQVMLTLQNFAPSEFELPGLTLSAVEADLQLAKFDLQVTMSERPDDGGFAVSFTYATDLFDESTIVSVAERFTRVLSAVVEDPQVVIGDVDFLTADERARSLKSGRGELAPASGFTVPDLIGQGVGRSRDAVAIVGVDSTLPSGEFGDRVAGLARYLISCGVGPDFPVAVAMSRSVEMVVAIHAVLAAGGAYVPIDPEQPDDRIAYVLDIADPLLVLSSSGEGIDTDRTVVFTDTLDVSDQPTAVVTDADRLAPLRPENAAYMLFTSGSTGRPKGVTVSHGR